MLPMLAARWTKGAAIAMIPNVSLGHPPRNGKIISVALFV
ncbi:hypothetical protein SELSPUOL_02121 [Selenomonas sputigena ATCC 35185]|uniref:Uncharacterized protein n=1 Tax=Selenomonas sputigena (strain ATCC 35185 / DSM 20758 / CCUG 44933 / VPI D19B-28) TaxID=546271 RepID=C9LXB3_SELS3|nr:hypothetical protein SELSPUOL_02121 [Selenomonas sputigena ATCC 35185]